MDQKLISNKLFLARKFFLVSVLLISTLSSVAQNGYLRGKIIDKTLGEPLFGATVVKEGTVQGAVADFDGNYSLPLSPGTHTILYQSVGFKTITVESVNIEEGESTVMDIYLLQYLLILQ